MILNVEFKTVVINWSNVIEIIISGINQSNSSVIPVGIADGTAVDKADGLTVGITDGT